MKETKVMQSALNTAGNVNDGFKYMFLLGLLLNLLGSGEEQLMFGMIRSFQLILHLPIM